jgi:hypothetical protein
MKTDSTNNEIPKAAPETMNAFGDDVSNALQTLFIQADEADTFVGEAIVTLQMLISAAEAGNVIDEKDLETVAKSLRTAAFFSRAVRDDVRDALRRENPDAPELIERQRVEGDYPAARRAETAS